MTKVATTIFVELVSCPEGDQRGDEEPEEALHEEEHEAPEAEALDPGSDAHSSSDINTLTLSAKVDDPRPLLRFFVALDRLLTQLKNRFPATQTG